MTILMCNLVMCTFNKRQNHVQWEEYKKGNRHTFILHPPHVPCLSILVGTKDMWIDACTTFSNMRDASHDHMIVCTTIAYHKIQHVPSTRRIFPEGDDVALYTYCKRHSHLVVSVPGAISTVDRDDLVAVHAYVLSIRQNVECGGMQQSV